MLKDIFKLILSVSCCLFVGFSGSLATAASITSWYITLQKPFFNPPNWLFAPVWTFLYILMGVAAFLIWKKGWSKRAVRYALKLFLLQLALNFLWSVIFFGFHLPLLALGEISILWIAIFLTIRAFYPVQKQAAWILIPYLGWVTFASLLNLFIVLLN